MKDRNRHDPKALFRPGLFLAALLALGLLSACGSATDAPGVTEVDAAQAQQLIAQKAGQDDFGILDIRTPQEYQAGHIENAVNIDYYNADFEKELDKLNKEKTYLVYCRSGNRSASALRTLGELGFTDIRHLHNGIRDWMESGLPLVK